MSNIRAAACEMFQSYRDVPFHGADHADEVTSSLAIMGVTQDVAAILAGAGHDIDHTFCVQSDDELRAAQISHRIGQKYGIDEETRLRVEYLILGTVFKDRPNLSADQQIIADADVANVGGDFDHHMRCTARLIMETHIPTGKAITRDVILSGFRRNIGFYAFLTGITGKQDNPFLTPQGQKAFPHFARNRDMFLQKLEQDPEYFYGIVCSEWRRFFRTDLKLEE